ncbi:hypothetical protein Hanom_Chr07g00625851 [Helianthus anomalus]
MFMHDRVNSSLVCRCGKMGCAQTFGLVVLFFNVINNPAYHIIRKKKHIVKIIIFVKIR